MRLFLALGCLMLAACRGEPVIPSGGPLAGWPTYGSDPGGSRYSPLEQITPENVSYLEEVWTYHTGDIADGTSSGKGAFEATPILLGDSLIFCSPFNRVFSLDAETGAERWVYDPEVPRDLAWGYTCRGVAAWTGEERDEGEACARRILSATTDARLIALDAATGRPCRDFGEDGQVDLTRGLGKLLPGEYRVTSPPTVIGDVVVVGALVADNRRVGGAPGVVRGFDVRSGALRWAFDPVAPETPPAIASEDGRIYHAGTPNSWSISSADLERDLLFVPMGSSSPDFYGGHRAVEDFYASSVVALRGMTGEVVWSFQTVHHDLWDYDVAAQPTLIELELEGRSVPALVQATKIGHVFILNRETGEPVFPVEERPVAQTDVPGERTSATQPFPTHPPPLHPPKITPEDAWGLTPWDRGACRKLIASLRNEGTFTPPSLRGSIQFPGVAGGINWGGVAWDPVRKLLVMNTSRVANVQTLVPRAEVASHVPDPPMKILFPQLGTPYAAEQAVLVSPLGIPCTPPPWGTLLAIDLESGAVIWEIPFGTTREQTPLPFGFSWGLPSMGGALVTASGLVFIGATLDADLHAYDIRTGEELWRTRLPAGGQATPMTYRLRQDSRQLVVIAAGGHATLGTRSGDAVVAYGLPRH